MANDIYNFLNATFGVSAGVAFVILLICFWIAVRVAAWKERIKHIDKVDANIDKIKDDISYIKAEIDVGKNFFLGDLAHAHSPISLTELGKQKASDMQIEQRLSNNWDNIMSLIDKNVQEKNPYDIQQYCIELGTINFEKVFKKEDIDAIKFFAFKEGKPVGYYGIMIGILIRDKYFKDRQIDLAEVDKNDPNRKL